MHATAHQHLSGFTAIELMVTLAILAILLGVAVPSFSSFTEGQRLRAASSDLRTDLTFARSEALKRNQPVTIRRRSAAGWNSGWIVAVTGSGQELRVRNEIGRGVSLSGAADAVTFNGSGRVASPAGIVQFALAAASASSSTRCVVLDPSGLSLAYAEPCS
jgi:type IV fimbrial biogenesis protein FimT